ncbi:MAG: terminase small subunit [Rhizobiales bacterium]|nr:terminase small subunit [Hyphomicrobiales bacterium]
MMTVDAAMSPLTPKQSRFVEEYLLDMNATQAAIRAGYSQRTAKEQGAQLLTKPAVMAAVDAAKIDRSERTKIDADRVLQEIAVMAFYDPADLMIDGEAGEDDREAAVIDGRVIYGLRGPADIKRLPESVRRAIVGWGWDRNENFTLKLADKSKALDQLARHLSLYNDKVEIDTPVGWADRVARACEIAQRDALEQSRAARAAAASAPSLERHPGAPPAECTAPAAPPPAPPVPVAPPPPKPYRPIMPDPAPVSWPTTIAHATTDYDPNDI